MSHDRARIPEYDVLRRLRIPANVFNDFVSNVNDEPVQYPDARRSGNSAVPRVFLVGSKMKIRVNIRVKVTHLLVMTKFSANKHHCGYNNRLDLE